MTVEKTLILLLVLEIYTGLISWRFYQKAGHPAWAAFVPFYNSFIFTKIIQRPRWWAILFYIPIVNNVMAIVGAYELLHVFNRHKVKYTIYTILSLGLYLAYLNYNGKLNYVGRSDKTIRKYVSELTSSLLFAIVAATIIRTFTFEAFTIPTPSMEKSLMVGDFLFVSKLQYGCRLPITPVTLPLVHNKIPVLNTKSYWEKFQLPYLRLPRISDVERLDPVVFNYPMQDDMPIDKRDHYVKRCVAIPGDTLSIIDGQVYIDGEAQILPDRALPQFSYYVQLKPGQVFNAEELKSRFDINYIDPMDQDHSGSGAVLRLNRKSPVEEYVIAIPSHHLAAFKAYPKVQEVVMIVDGKAQANRKIFPNQFHVEGDSLLFQWSRDNYGPIYMPKAGDIIELNEKNYFLFKRIIEEYEGNELKVNEDKYILNGEETTTYTFKQGYYWMMGDNRHNSEDSRFWGYVPADHIVGKPVFIWMSYDKYARDFKDKIRTARVFTTVSGEGERVSYFWAFMVVVVIGYFYNKSRKKKKLKSSAKK